MKLIVGLGNPNFEYNNTRHNMGYMFLDYILENEKFMLNKKFNAYQYETELCGEKIVFVKPLSYMNLSGDVVSKYVNYYKLNLNDLLIIQDDLDMELGKYKLLYNHGDGGHNGIKDITNKINSRQFLRLKIGISKANGDVKSYVLGKFSKDELVKVKEVFLELKDIIYDYVSMDRDLLIGKYNSK